MVNYRFFRQKTIDNMSINPGIFDFYIDGYLDDIICKLQATRRNKKAQLSVDIWKKYHTNGLDIEEVCKEFKMSERNAYRHISKVTNLLRYDKYFKDIWESVDED